MDGRSLTVLFLLLHVFIGTWQDKRTRGLRQDIHYHSKRHMLPRAAMGMGNGKRTTPRGREKKKPSGYPAPLQEDEIADDEIVSVAVGPPARTKYEKLNRTPKTNIESTNTGTNIVVNNKAINLVKDVIVELAKDLLSREVNEDFVFGQYIATAMKNIKTEHKNKIRHEILELIQRYQQVKDVSSLTDKVELTNTTQEQIRKVNASDEIWPDFTNLENIVT